MVKAGWVPALFSAAMILGLPPSVLAQPLPPLIGEIQAEIRRDCGGASFEPGFITTANITPDGRPDYILDYSRVTCRAGRTFYCGTGGCSLDFVISDGSGYRKGGSLLVRSFRVIPSPTGDSLNVSLHGSECGRDGTASCERVYSWQRGQLAPRR